MSQERVTRESGFTLIELLIVVAIIGILAAVAMPQFLVYRKGAFDAEAKVALRTVATAEEAYFTENESYISCDQTTCPGLLPNVDTLNNGIVLEMVASPTEFSGSAYHENGSLEIFEWD